MKIICFVTIWVFNDIQGKDGLHGAKGVDEPTGKNNQQCQ